ncbi:alpha/beta fold hydrolase [Flindersiella endophytica]
MDSVRSKDGTRIAYERQGGGPPVILATGALDDGAENAPLAAELAASFTTYNYNRRGRGASGDTPPYSLQREIEDLAALIAEAGETANLYGVSSGGALVLEAAAAGLPVGKVAVYEVPYLVDPAMRQQAEAYAEQLRSVLAEHRHADALELFMRLAGSPDEQIEAAKRSEYWPGLLELAPTLAYDAACSRNYKPALEVLARIRQPTLVATGGTVDYFESAADVLAATVPNAERLVLEGQGHVADPKAVVPVLERFFTQPEVRSAPSGL